ncbi:cytochrome C oxidase subunit III [Bacillus cytotoxicus]|uniref:cytochrome C oxidase subunit III n=1 Tax=Bacillus cereus group sp. BfR-BA-01492 TaxID=2920361 RepID=UPI001F5992B3|nr:cytochrome C oxidase subunit III [Bacillus cereus group sp. BfR-BA-01492]EMA6345038.1 cytochrome C oxidase subunit III [Bacillus cytotoxicus]
MRNHYQQNSYSAQQWHQYSAQQQMLQQQGFVKKKGCNCGKKNHKNNQQKERY